MYMKLLEREESSRYYGFCHEAGICSYLENIPVYDKQTNWLNEYISQFDKHTSK